MFGDKLFPAEGRYPTPESVPIDLGTRALCVPSSAAWFAVIMGALMVLADEDNWIAFDGGITVADAAEVAQQIIDNAYDETCLVPGTSDYPTPFWDGVTDTDDEYPVETQPWYGYVTDPEAAPGELTFVEDATIWTLTGMLAVSASPAAALLFQTIAPRFALAMRGGDLIEIIRVIFDGEEQARITTTGNPDELIEIPVVGDAGISVHDLLIVLESVT